MKCLICGRLSLPGAKLCLDCKAARKRAFEATVTQPLLAAAGAARRSASPPRLLKPSQSVPGGARRAAKMALAAQAQARTEPDPAPQRSSRLPMVVVGVGVVALLLAFFAHWFGGGSTETFTAVPTQRPLVEDSPAASAVPATVNAPLPAAVVPIAPDTSVTAAAGKIEPAKRPITKPKTEKAPPPVPVVEPAPEPVVVVAPPPPVVREAPRVDPWQPMNDALARCAANDMSGRLSCEHRVRTQYCEGRWGQVAQCASIPYVEHGG